MKKTDFVINRGTEKLKIERGVKINDKSSSLSIEITLNNKKGIYGMKASWDFSQVTDNEKDDKSTIETIGELMMEARKYCKDWRKNWLEKNAEKDDSQMGMFDKDENGKLQEGFE